MPSRKSKPIRIFWSVLSQRFYASRAYKEIQPGVVEITGDQFDVTDEIADAIIRHSITFTPAESHFPAPPVPIAEAETTGGK